MASTVVAELEAGLQAMLSLKPPGVSGSRITNITALCVANVQYESVLIQKLFTHFKKTPGTHKLGVLYVVDSVTRKWLDQAKAQGQTPSLSAPDGTFAAGVHRVTELIPILMNDIIATAPEDQKEKIKKLVDIWEKGQTFPPSMVNSFKEKLNAPRPTNQSTTPPGSPPPNLLGSLGPGSKPEAPPAPPASQAVPNSILDKLASIARQNASSAQSNPNLAATAPALTPAPASNPTTAPVLNASGAPPSNGPIQPVNVPGLPYGNNTTTTNNNNNNTNTNNAFPPAPPAQAGPPAAPVAPAAAAPVAVPPPPSGPSNPAAATVQLVAALAAQGIPIDKIAGVIQMMNQTGALAAPAPPQMPQPTQTGYAAPPPIPGAVPGPAPWDARPEGARDRTGYRDGMRSPNRPRGRSRSRSPSRWDPRGSPRSRANDRGFDYGRPGSPGRNRADDRDRRGHMSEYRQRSPHGRHGDGPGQEPPQQEKWVEYDNSLPSGCIKVYSRTLFVGGVTCSEHELREIFNRFGSVQTCIVNKEKRHAFVKMYYRKDAERAKDAMEDMRGQEYNLRTRWGVGFGPRDCSDYQSGISVIPIHKLTEADRKWMLTAPYGGSGGRPIVSGMCVEEPDIEIGAGVSSKAISRRMQTDKGGNHGPKSSRRAEDESPAGGFGGGHGHGGYMGGGGSGPGGGGNMGAGGPSGGRWRNKGGDKHHGGLAGRDQRRGGGNGDDRNNKGGNNDEPIVMGLPAGITMGPNGINLPPNFTFGTTASQP
ncbi:hypothetical protein MYCTH_2312563 [Thermothelomyces thermophilus ATCC 42464]|uniref:Uncharacterized protein n=1 Tax=Thermothelomyces thermophilus (strain ATCC 42464 / BCRC 31852 / DSM 1799) TaxID=573729 RepID=G2QN00_THET4|nr:uncharacterized protein MYCTH_2312563 [Thermothelomyces thermophilus ATCC 42464]AEO61873.1 hypothetical protein MYCTH_2312563 [Thermothelomyces thermophilus ATCC 42464]